jgi:uncharacterized protein DUF4124
MKNLARLISLVALLVSGPAAAQMFKCTNAAGKITYSGTKCGDLGLKDAGEVKDRVSVNPAYQPPKAAPRQQPPAPRAATPPSPQPATARRDDDDNSCEAQKRRYLEAAECFAQYTNVNGSIRQEGFQNCPNVRQPRC